MASYTVQLNDTLWKIAEHFYSNGDLWPRIHQANLAIIPDENQIRPGMQLFIPDDASNPPPPPVVGGTAPPELPGGDARARVLIEAARRKGVPYRIDPPPDGVNNLDCSLYVLVTYKGVGLPFPNGVRTAEQIRQACESTGGVAEPGDLVFFQHTYEPAEDPGPDGNVASHVGIVVNESLSTMWDSHESTIPNRASGVDLTDIRTPYWRKHLLEVRRPRNLANVGSPQPVQPPPVPAHDQVFTADEIRTVMPMAGNNVETYWPALVAGLTAAGCCDTLTQIAVIATIRVETSGFAPIHEFGGESYFTKMYEGRADLGNTQPGDGVRFHGRGFIQLTGRSNYQRYGAALGIDLVANPDLALDPGNAARIFVKYFTDRNIPAMAAARNWPAVRSAVNGGLTGWEDFIAAVNALTSVAQSRGML